MSVTFGSARLQRSFWKESLDKDRASFPLVGIGGKEEGRNQIIKLLEAKHHIASFLKVDYITEVSVSGTGEDSAC